MCSVGGSGLGRGGLFQLRAQNVNACQCGILTMMQRFVVRFIKFTKILENRGG